VTTEDETISIKKNHPLYSALPAMDEFDDDFRTVFGLNNNDDGSPLQNVSINLKTEIQNSDAQKTLDNSTNYTISKTQVLESEDDIPDIFGTKSRDTESIPKPTPMTSLNETDPISLPPSRIPKPVPVNPSSTHFWGARLLDESSSSNRSSTLQSAEQSPAKVRSTAEQSPAIVRSIAEQQSPAKVRSIAEQQSPAKVRSIAEQQSPAKVRPTLRNQSKPSDDSNGGFLSFIKGAIQKDNRIRDEDDYRPTKPPPPPPKEEEIDESELIGQPNPIWG